MPGLRWYTPDRSAEMRAKRKRVEARRIAKWEAEKTASLRAKGWTA